MHKTLINNDMKDSIRSLKISNAVMTVSAVLAVALLAVIGGAFINSSSALAEESPEKTRIAADIDESYFFSVEENDRLAQKLETRSEQRESEAADADNDNNIEETNDADLDQCGSLYIEDHLRIDFDNDTEEVLRLQSFLKTYEGYDYVNLTGTFDETTLRAVKAFQTRYADDVLTPWGYQADEATGYVYITTKQKINEIYCDEQFMLSRDQQTEIREYREKLNEWRAEGASFETPQYLSNYYGYGQVQATTQPQDTTDSSRSELEPRTSEGGVTVTETPDDTATSATSTDDGRNFFQRLFGIGGPDDEATTTATTTDDDEDTDAQDDDEDEVATDDDETATDTATSTGLSNVAAGVYNGVNGIFNFLLSPTFLLVVLVVLILLLISTLIESDDEEEEADSDESGDDAEDADEVETEEETTGEAWDEYAETEVVDESGEADDAGKNEDKKDQ